MGDRTCGRCYRNVVRQCETCPYCYTAYHPSCYRLKNCCSGRSSNSYNSGQYSLIQYGYDGYSSSINLNNYSKGICGRCHKNVVRECRNCPHCSTPYHPSCYELKKCCKELTSNYNFIEKPKGQDHIISVSIDKLDSIILNNSIGRVCGRCQKNVVRECRDCLQCNTPYHPSCYEFKRCCNQVVNQKSSSQYSTELLTDTAKNPLRICGRCHQNVVRECKNCSQCDLPYHPSCYQFKTCCRDGQKSESQKLLDEIFKPTIKLEGSADRICGRCHKNVVRECKNCRQCNLPYHPSCYQNKTCCRDGEKSESQKLLDEIFKPAIKLDKICGRCHKNVVHECKKCHYCNTPYHPSCYELKNCCLTQESSSQNCSNLSVDTKKNSISVDLNDTICGKCNRNVVRECKNCTQCNKAYHPSCHQNKTCCKNPNNSYNETKLLPKAIKNEEYDYNQTQNLQRIKSEFDPFKVGLLNSRSMIKKFPIIQELVKEKSLSVFGLTETWLKEHHPNSSIAIEGYTHYRCDRSKRGGGLILYVKNDLKCKQINLPSNIDRSEVQQLWCEIEHKNKTRAIGLIYRPPNSQYKKLNYIHDAVAKVSSYYDDVTVMGDFNIHYSNEKETRQRTLLRELETDFKMAQLVEAPTRHAKNTATLLDHVYSNRPDSWKSVENVENNFSDHNLIVCTAQY